MDNLIEIGFVIKTHGYKGDLKIRIHDEINILEDKPRVFFVFLQDEHIPFFTESMTYFTDYEALVHFEDVQSKEEAAKLKGHKLYLQPDEVDIVKEQIEPEKYIGYHVEDLDRGSIGIVEQVLSYPQQKLLSVNYDGREILIPLRPELIHEVHEDSNRIIFNLPDGFLDL